MAYIKDSLSAGEEIKAEFSLHWLAWVWPVFWLLVFFPIGVYLIVGLVSQERGVTTKRIISKRGLISRKTEEVRLRTVETVEIDQGVLDRMLGCGTVRITGTGVSGLVLSGIDDPMEVKRSIESVLEPA